MISRIYLWKKLWPTLSRMSLSFSKTVSKCDAATYQTLLQLTSNWQQKIKTWQKLFAIHTNKSKRSRRANFLILQAITKPMAFAKPSLFFGKEILACLYIKSILAQTYVLSWTFCSKMPRHLHQKRKASHEFISEACSGN